MGRCTPFSSQIQVPFEIPCPRWCTLLEPSRPLKSTHRQDRAACIYEVDCPPLSVNGAYSNDNGLFVYWPTPGIPCSYRILSLSSPAASSQFFYTPSSNSHVPFPSQTRSWYQLSLLSYDLGETSIFIDWISWRRLALSELCKVSAAIRCVSCPPQIAGKCITRKP